MDILIIAVLVLFLPLIVVAVIFAFIFLFDCLGYVWEINVEFFKIFKTIIKEEIDGNSKKK